uniref:Uncharacterized protein n=1 Tax=Populus davidiana TaxID=266767 RepID=A0A6M2ENI4_9ROSI
MCFSPSKNNQHFITCRCHHLVWLANFTSCNIFKASPALCASVVFITGESKNVQNALFQVTSKLRDNLLPAEMLNGLRTGSPYRRTGEISRLHLSADESLDSNQETSSKKRVDQVRDPPSSSPQLPQKLHGERTTYSTDNGSSSTTSGKVSELERALHFLLPREGGA